MEHRKVLRPYVGSNLVKLKLVTTTNKLSEDLSYI